MSKTLVNSMITRMKKAGMVTKVSPWMNEGGEEVRYVGLKIKEWEDILPASNNFLAKFVTMNKTSWVSVLLANKPPFVFLTKRFVTKEVKWEQVLGSVRQRLNRDKKEYQSGKVKIDNWYVKIKPVMKKV